MASLEKTTGEPTQPQMKPGGPVGEMHGKFHLSKLWICLAELVLAEEMLAEGVLTLTCAACWWL